MSMPSAYRRGRRRPRRSRGGRSRQQNIMDIKIDSYEITSSAVERCDLSTMVKFIIKASFTHKREAHTVLIRVFYKIPHYKLLKCGHEICELSLDNNDKDPKFCRWCFKNNVFESACTYIYCNDNNCKIYMENYVVHCTSCSGDPTDKQLINFTLRNINLDDTMTTINNIYQYIIQYDRYNILSPGQFIAMTR